MMALPAVQSSTCQTKAWQENLVTEQDAQLDALQRIAEGKQTMTIYKPIIPLAMLL